MEETKSRFQRICVFCGSSSGKKPSYQEAAVELGKELVYIINMYIIYMYNWLYFHSFFFLFHRPHKRIWTFLEECFMQLKPIFDFLCIFFLVLFFDPILGFSHFVESPVFFLKMETQTRWTFIHVFHIQSLQFNSQTFLFIFALVGFSSLLFLIRKIY